MKTKMRSQRFLLLVAALLLMAAVFLVSQWYYYRLDRYLGRLGEEEAVTFSLEDNFLQAEERELTLALPGYMANYCEIHYTLDGSEPNAESPLYEGAIVLAESEERGGWVVKVRLVQDDAVSPVYTKSYFPLESAAYHEELLVVSISGDPADFYDEEYGLFGQGAASAEAAFADESLPLNKEGDARGNYYGRGEEWERPVMVEIFDGEGSLLLQQAAGMRITGGRTRDYEQKSLRLYARKSYDAQHGKFEAAPLFGEQVTADGSETPIVSYNHLDLRNGGNDYYYTMLSDATMRSIADESGFAPVGVARPAVVYINGEYYGLAWLQPDYCEKNIAEMCNLEVLENIQVLEEREGAAYSADFPDAYDEYIAMYDDIAMSDLTLAENAAKLEEAVDIDNFLLYYALEIYCNNYDWPHNNYKLWRYLDASEAELAENPYADGRWRLLLYDTDYAYNTYVDNVDGFEWAIHAQASPMLVSMLQNEDFKNRFVNIFCSLLSGTFSTEGASGIIYDAKDIIEGEMAFRESQDPQQKLFDHNYRQIMYRVLDDFLERRPGEIVTNLATYFGAETAYSLCATAPETGGSILYCGFSLAEGESLTGTFYREAPLTLTCRVAAGYQFDYWEVNGERVQTPTLVVGGDAEGQETLDVRLVLREDEDAGLLLSALCYQNGGGQDYVALTNYERQEIMTAGMYLLYQAEGKEDSERIDLPQVRLSAGETLRLYEESNQFTYDDIGSYIADFNLREGGQVWLYDDDGHLLDACRLPRNHDGWVYTRSTVRETWRWTKLEGLEDGANIDGGEPARAQVSAQYGQEPGARRAPFAGAAAGRAQPAGWVPRKKPLL